MTALQVLQVDYDSTRHKNGMAVESALYCRGAPVGSEAPGGRALGADVDRLLSRRRDVPLWSRLVRCEVSFGM